MSTRQTVRAATTLRADELRVELGGVGLAVANPLRGQPLIVPRDVRLGDTPEGDPALLWRVPPPTDDYGLRHDWALGGTPEQALWAFVELADEDRPDRFLAFARRFGVLGLWPYRTPAGHKVMGIDHWVPSVPEGILTPIRYTVFHTGDERHAVTAAGLLGMMYEPVAEWRRWARWLRAAIAIAFELRCGRVGRRRDWDALDWGFLFDPTWHRDAARYARDPAAQRRELANVVQARFLKWSGLAPVFRWVDRPALSLSLGGREAILMRRYSMQQDWPENCLYPALVAQLLAFILVGEGASCTRCGRIHQRRRRPPIDGPAYCPACRRQMILATKRESKRRATARLREAPA
jgi:hypothetical protein